MMGLYDWSNDFICTPVQVVHLLSKLAGKDIRTGALGSVVVLPGGAAVIQCQKKPPRMVGMDTLSVTQVNVSFKGVAQADRLAFLKSFEDAVHSALG
jgi:hypothetical protein